MGWMIQTMERHWRVLSKEIMRSDSETLFQKPYFSCNAYTPFRGRDERERVRESRG